MAAEFPNIRVLLVEDDEISIYVMEKILSKYFRVVVARNGIEAIHMVNRDNFDIVLLDIQLGHSMDGTEVLEELRKDSLNDETKVFAITGMALQEDADYYLNLGFDEFFAKPLNHHDLAQAIKEACLAKAIVN
jgi:two-component system cell cycle response regulator DivK